MNAFTIKKKGKRKALPVRFGIIISNGKKGKGKVLSLQFIDSGDALAI